MFAGAYEMASKITKPLITSIRLYNKEVTCGGGAFIIINKEGWVITAHHMVQSFITYKRNQQEIQSYDKKIASIENDNSLTVKQKNRKLKQVKPNEKWITNHSFWWACDDVLRISVKSDTGFAPNRPSSRANRPPLPGWMEQCRVQVSLA